jgi:hypothetical protein
LISGTPLRVSDSIFSWTQEKTKHNTRREKQPRQARPRQTNPLQLENLISNLNWFIYLTLRTAERPARPGPRQPHRR